MSKEQRTSLQFSVDESARSIRFLNPPISSDVNGDRFMRDMHRIQWFAKGNGFEQTSDCWSGSFEDEEFISAIRYLKRVGWEQVGGQSLPVLCANEEPTEQKSGSKGSEDIKWLIGMWRDTAKNADAEHADIFNLCANELEAVIS